MALGTDLRASLRMVVRRARSDTTVLTATGVTVILATTLLAAGPMYADAVSTSGLRSTLASGSPSEVGIRLVARASADDAAAVASSLEEVATRHLGRWLAVTDRVVESGSVELDALPDAHVAVVATATRLEGHVELVGGAWPDAANRRAGEPRAVLHEEAATLALALPTTVIVVVAGGIALLASLLAAAHALAARGAHPRTVLEEVDR